MLDTQSLNKIALIGGSKGAELALNLASRYEGIGTVVGIVPADVSFPAHTILANTSSWTYNNQEVIYVPAPFKTIIPAIKGDLLAAFEMMLEDDEAVSNSLIPIEKINGSILFLSATNDEQWPSKMMSERMMERLTKNKFAYTYKHHAINGRHAKPLQHFDIIFNFLEEEFK